MKLRTRITTAATVAAVVGLLAFASSVGATQPHPDHKVGLCHRTASDTNPYVYIEVDEAAVDTHLHNGQGHPPKTNEDGSPRNDYLADDASDCEVTSSPPPDDESPSPSPTTTPSQSPEPSASPTPEPSDEPSTEPSPTPSVGPSETPVSPAPSSTPKGSTSATSTSRGNSALPQTDTAFAATSAQSVVPSWVLLAVFAFAAVYTGLSLATRPRR